MRLPWDKFCYSDFERDTAVLSNEATGIWIRILCRTWTSPRRGFLLHATGKPFTDEDAATWLRISVERWREVKDELLRTGVASAEKGTVIYNRRQVNDEKERAKERLKKGEQRQNQRKSLSNHEKCPGVVPHDVPHVVPALSRDCPGENQKSEVRSQNIEAAAIAAAVVPPVSGRAAPPAARPIRTPELTPDEWDQPDPTVEAHRLVNRLMRLHPKPGNAQLAQAALARILVGAVNMAAVCADIERNHAAWAAYWQEEPKAFRPMLHRWFQDGDYMHSPARQQQPSAQAAGCVQW